MSILGYNFSMQGESHKTRNMVCQDSSLIYFKGGWKMAVVADGVGSCRCADAASKIAAESICRLVDTSFPVGGSDKDFLSMMRTAMHYAANSIDRYVLKNGGNIDDYHTTLAAALYNGTDVYYSNAGDSGIIILDGNGVYRPLTTQQDNEYGEVITLARRQFEIGKSSCSAAAVICMTDGLLEWCMPLSLSKYKYRIHVPRMGLIVPEEVWFGENEPSEQTVSEHSRRTQEILSGLAARVFTDDFMDEQYGNLTDRNLCDDLSAAVMMNPEVLLDSIKWENPPEKNVLEKYVDTYNYYKALYPSDGERMLREHIRNSNPEMNDEDLENYVNDVIRKAENDSPTDEEQPAESAENTAPKNIVHDDTDKGTTSLTDNELTQKKREDSFDMSECVQEPLIKRVRGKVKRFFS